MVSVEDNGIGISEEGKQQLFQPFKQAQRSAGGTGLGLFSLSKRIGTTSFSTVFYQYIPLNTLSPHPFTIPFHHTITTISPLILLPTLSPCHTLDAIGGIFGVRDRSDGKQGSCFYFTFPYRPDYSAIEDGESNSNNGSVNTARGYRMSSARGMEVNPFATLAPLRILLADDSASVLKVTTRCHIYQILLTMIMLYVV